MSDADEYRELLAMLESAGSGLAVLELADEVALTAPTSGGVATLLPLTGRTYVLCDGRKPVSVEVGQLALVPSGMATRLAARRHAPRIVDSRTKLARRGGWIVASARTGEKPAATVAAARIIGSRAAALSDIAVMDVTGLEEARPLHRQLAAEVGLGAAGHAGIGMALMNACVMHAIRAAGRGDGQAGFVPADAPAGGIARALATIRSEPQDEHSLASLAALAGMSRSSFVRGFNRVTGTSPQRFLQQVRLEEAAALLRSSLLPIKAIAAMTGFRSRSHFSRSFSEAFSVDPSTYRQKLVAEGVPHQLATVPERL